MTLVAAMCLVVVVVVGTDVDTTTSVQEDVLQKPEVREQQEAPDSRMNDTKDFRQVSYKHVTSNKYSC